MIKLPPLRVRRGLGVMKQLALAENCYGILQSRGDCRPLIIMPDITLAYRVAMFLRRFPPIHRPLRWLRRSVWDGAQRLMINTARALTANSTTFGPAARLFSIKALLERKELEGRIVLETQGSPSLPEPSLQVISGLRQHASQPWPILWSRHQNARLISSSLALLNDRKELAAESVYHGFHVNDPAYNQMRLPPPVRLPGRWTSLVSWWSDNTAPPLFSHWIMDALPRLGLFKEFPADTGILVSTALAGYQKESLKLLGLLDRVRYTPERHLLVEDYYFSSPTAMIGCYNPYGVAWLRSAFLPLADRTYQGPKRFVIQRRGKSRGIENNDEVNAYFESLGWAIIDTEKLTFAQELQLFSQAEAFAGVLGSGFTNGIWSSPGCKVISFVADTWQDGWVEWICGVNQLEYHWQLFPANHATMITVPREGLKKLLQAASLPTL